MTRLLNLKDLIGEFVEFRHEVVCADTLQLKSAKKAHLLQGYLIAPDHLDEVIDPQFIHPEIAGKPRRSRMGLDEVQAKAILELRLQRLTGMERDKIKEEYEEIMKQIVYLSELENKYAV